ncbi:hypothetical protein GIB67_030857 [Kingdonia uniflora]|uniref:RNase H type-1 domain-containing protein n=1 Tax=Kingdonia uniflora TaxID=39325 RepID=A0A7J7L3B9_9MAGN|nr:hypothetical protein GIB67_030857 [Kingdonia uniflora]
MQAKFTNKAGDVIRYHKKSTIWPVIKLAASINRPFMGCDFINSDGWDIPSDIRILLLALGINVVEIPCNPREEDKRIWKPDRYGKFTVQNAYETLSIGNQGDAGICVVFRDSEGAVLGTLSKAIGISTSFVAEILAMLTGIQKAIDRGWLYL